MSPDNSTSAFNLIMKKASSPVAAKAATKTPPAKVKTLEKSVEAEKKNLEKTNVDKPAKKEKKEKEIGMVLETPKSPGKAYDEYAKKVAMILFREFCAKKGWNYAAENAGKGKKWSLFSECLDAHFPALKDAE